MPPCWAASGMLLPVNRVLPVPFHFLYFDALTTPLSRLSESSPTDSKHRQPIRSPHKPPPSWVARSLATDPCPHPLAQGQVPDNQGQPLTWSP